MKALAGAAGVVSLVGTATLIGVAAMVPSITAANDSTTLTASAVSCMLPGDESTADGLTADQMSNIAAIISTAKSLGFSEQGVVVALATAAQESMFRSGLGEAQSDRDSAGLFQQRRPWGPLEDRLDPAKSTTMFLTGGLGGQPGLDSVAGWEQMPVWQAAQTVQVSAFPQAYAKWEPLARTLAGGVSCEQDTDFTALPGATEGERAVNAAARWFGTPYSWGGGGWNGPSRGIAQGAGTVGFDCSGLTMYGWYQATNGAVRLDHYTDNQAAATTAVSRQQAQAGDLIFFNASAGGGSGSYPHVGMYDGQGGMIHAPRTGKNVERVANIFTDPYWSSRIGRIGRPHLSAKA